MSRQKHLLIYEKRSFIAKNNLKKYEFEVINSKKILQKIFYRSTAASLTITELLPNERF